MIPEHAAVGLKLHVTLWDAFAEQFNGYVSIHKDEGLVVVVIQFAVVKIYREKSSLSNSFNGTRLFINSEIDEIKDFRNSLLGLSGESKSSQQLTMLSGLSYSYREDFLDNNSKANIAEISEVIEAKSLIILGTVKAFSKDIPWFYMGCKRCSRKIRPTYIITDKNDGSGQVEEIEKVECNSDKCKGQDTDVLPNDVLRSMQHEPEIMFETLKHRIEEYIHDEDNMAGAMVAGGITQSFHNMPYLTIGSSCCLTAANGNNGYYYCSDEDFTAGADAVAGEDEQWSYVRKSFSQVQSTGSKINFFSCSKKVRFSHVRNRFDLLLYFIDLLMSSDRSLLMQLDVQSELYMLFPVCGDLHGDLEMFPEDLNVLLDRKFAIKIEVNNYNIKNSCFVYGISKLTDDENILNELEMRFSAQRPAESDSVKVLSPDFGSVEKLKDAVSFTGENATPSNVDKSTADSPVSQEKTYQKKICLSVYLKRDFDEIYDADDAMKGSATKSSKTCISIEKE
ncbi:hypothetical protein L6452_26516 [Arctium lappa]|uniref:Uncharacterized protein n=1 Tax=Arctium lappa TaxID=4217 RepID=A0ACB8ZV99_ARCLA|nr:hypothetical protein L6452_26516 [Arctium lappa]